MDPPPPTTDSTAEAQIAPAANPTPTKSPVHNHPPYAEMITAAIGALKERGGSSKRAIAKYIESHYSKLPPTHSALLSHHLKRLKNSGQVLMVKNSYKLAKSANVPVAVNGNGNPGSVSSAVGPTKKRPGRPPKNAQAGVPIPVFAHEAQKAIPLTDSVPIVGDASSAGVGMKRGRGRPPKNGVVNKSGLKRRPGRPPKSVVAQPVGGDTSSAAVGTEAAAPGRPRGRPPKIKNMVAGVAPSVADGGAAVPMNGEMSIGGLLAAVSGVVRKRPGRPPKAGLERKKPLKPRMVKPKKTRRLSGKPLGRPRKAASNAVSRALNFQQQTTYGDIKGKLENLQSKVKQVVTVVKPYLNDETAISALQELEILASMDGNAPTNVQTASPQPQNVQTASTQPQLPQITEVEVVP